MKCSMLKLQKTQFNLLTLFVIILILADIYIWHKKGPNTLVKTILSPNTNTTKIYYALAWNSQVTPFHILTSKGREVFIKNRCKFTNCFVTRDKNYFNDVTSFDAVLFSGHWLALFPNLPEKRSIRQKYIYVNIDPASSPQNYLIYRQFDNFFNLTWTYRLSSDIVWRYFVILDRKGKEIGPKIGMKWRESFEPTSEGVKQKLSRKDKAVAWIATSCKSATRREAYVNELKKQLLKYNLALDIFGKCGIHCGNHSACHNFVEKHYYFYLAFENAYEEDYVPEVLIAYQHFTLPVVRGTANYSRFLPRSSYIDAQKLSPQTLAATIKTIISNFTLYENYFRWTNHYTFKHSLNTEVCNFCEAMNDETLQASTVYKDFVEWWKGYPTTREEFINLMMHDKSLRDSVYATLNPKRSINKRV